MVQQYRLCLGSRRILCASPFRSRASALLASSITEAGAGLRRARRVPAARVPLPSGLSASSGSSSGFPYRAHWLKRNGFRQQDRFLGRRRAPGADDARAGEAQTPCTQMTFRFLSAPSRLQTASAGQVGSAYPGGPACFCVWKFLQCSWGAGVSGPIIGAPKAPSSQEIIGQGGVWRHTNAQEYYPSRIPANITRPPRFKKHRLEWLGSLTLSGSGQPEELARISLRRGLP